MESDSFALRTAIFVLFGTALLLLTWTVFNNARGETQPFLVVTDRSISGMALQSRVYYKGVEVGTVENIFFEQGDYDHVRILILVDQNIPIASNTYAQLALRGVTGEYDLRLENDGRLGSPLSTSEATPGVIPMRAEYISSLSETIRQTLIDMSGASARVAAFLDEASYARVQRMLSSVASVSEQLALLDRRLAPTLEGLPALVDSAESTLARYRLLAADLSTQSQAIDPALSKLAAASASLVDLAERLQGQTLGSANDSLSNIDRASHELTLLIEDLRQDPQRLLLGAPEQGYGPGEVPRELKP